MLSLSFFWAQSVANGSTDVLEHILSCEGCDVDPINRLEGATPLHLAVKIEHPALKHYIIESLMDAGADATYGSSITRARWGAEPFCSHQDQGQERRDSS